MKVFNTEKALQATISLLLKEGKTIGFVPTMGALHAGHISLIKAAKRHCDVVLCSIFVNPTQFDKAEDLEKYPRTETADQALLQAANCDFLFLPTVEEIYPNGKDNYTPPNIGNIVNLQEGKHRKGHFDGVMQVVERLLRITLATHLFMGLKDYQQFLICNKMVAARQLNVKMQGMPIIREKDGLAMSSRNVRLSKEGRKTALKLSKRLRKSKKLIAKHNYQKVEKKAIKYFHQIKEIDLEYFEIVDKTTLLPPENKDQKENLIALLAAWVDGVRLIDNMFLD